MGAAPDFRQDEAREGSGIADAGEIREATMRLPERQREALALHGRDGLSYEEIASTIAMSPGAVAQLIAHGRINLYDELHGTVLASVAPSRECERALPLIAAREDGELDAGSDDAAWLDAHLSGCERCRLGEEQMRDAAAAYRSAPPLAVAGAAPARAGERSGAPGRAGESSRRVTGAVAAVALLLLLTGLALAFTGGDRSTPVSPASGTATEQGAAGAERDAKPAKAGKAGKAKRGAAKARKKKRAAAASSATAATGPGETAAAGTTFAPSSSPQGTGTGGGGSSEPTSGRGPSSG